MGSETIAIEALRKAGDAGFVAPRLHAAVVAADEGLRLHRVHCHCGESGYEAREVTPAPLFVFVHRGSFRRRTRTGETLADAGFAYFANPGADEEFAHPNPGGDVTTSITITPELLSDVTAGGVTLPERALVIDADAHRRLRQLVAGAEHPGGEWVEHGINLFGDLIRAGSRSATPCRRASTAGTHRRLVDGVREALAADPSLGVTELARMLDCSPYHLSRVFRKETTTTVSAHRLRLRVREAAARIAEGERNLARLAADLGFSDHSHLTRLLVREYGATPTAIRAEAALAAG